MWKLLVKFLSTEVDEETEAAAKCIGKMIEPLPDGVDNPTWRQAYDNGIVTTVVKVKITQPHTLTLTTWKYLSINYGDQRVIFNLT